MTRFHYDIETLTGVSVRWAAFLTLTFSLIFSSHFSHADPLPQADQDLLRARVNEVTTYIRKEALQGISILPNDTREMLGWFSGNWHQVNVAQEDVPDAADEMPSGAPGAGIPAVNEDGSANFGTNFHHKGFLPTHDSMLMGINFKNNLIPGKLDFNARPYIGQSFSLHDYWGSEAALDIAHKDDDAPWGKIAIGFIGGNDALTDHGRGIEMHGDVDLTEGWKFTTGIRQNSSDGNSNYMLIKWKLNL